MNQGSWARKKIPGEDVQRGGGGGGGGGGGVGWGGGGGCGVVGVWGGGCVALYLLFIVTIR